LRLLAKGVYESKVFYHDLLYAKHPKGRDFSPKTHVEQFSNFAFLFATLKFAEGDLSEWERRAALTTGATRDLEVGRCSPPPHVSLFLKILDKNKISIDTWATDHHLARSIVFEWKAARIAGTSLKGKVSDSKIVEIEKAIEGDAKELGLQLGPSTRTDSD
jgi:hypothetical protein